MFSWIDSVVGMDDFADSLQPDNGSRLQRKLGSPPLAAASPPTASIHEKSPRIRSKNGITYPRRQRIPYEDVFGGQPKYCPPSHALVFADVIQRNGAKWAISKDNDAVSRLPKSAASEPSRPVLDIHHTVQGKGKGNVPRRLSVIRNINYTYEDLSGKVSSASWAPNVLPHFLGVANKTNKLQPDNHYTELGKKMPMTDLSEDKFLSESIISHQASGYSVQNSNSSNYPVLIARNNDSTDSVKDVNDDDITMASTATQKTQHSLSVEGLDMDPHDLDGVNYRKCSSHVQVNASRLDANDERKHDSFYEVRNCARTTSFKDAKVHKEPCKFEDPIHSRLAESFEPADICWISVSEVKLVTKPTYDSPPSRPPPLLGPKVPAVLDGLHHSKLPLLKIAEDVSGKFVESDLNILAEHIGDILASITEEGTKIKALENGMVATKEVSKSLISEVRETQSKMMKSRERKMEGDEAEAGLPQCKHFGKEFETCENYELVEFDVEQEEVGTKFGVNSEDGSHSLWGETKIRGNFCGQLKRKDCQRDDSEESNILKPRHKEQDKKKSESGKEKLLVEFGVLHSERHQSVESDAVHELKVRKGEGEFGVLHSERHQSVESDAVHELKVRKGEGYHVEHEENDNDTGNQKEVGVAKEKTKKLVPELMDNQSDVVDKTNDKESENSTIHKKHLENNDKTRGIYVIWNSETEGYKGQTNAQKQGNGELDRESVLEEMNAQQKHEKVRNGKEHLKESEKCRIAVEISTQKLHHSGDCGVNAAESITKERTGNAKGKKEITAADNGKAEPTQERVADERATAILWENVAAAFQKSEISEARPKGRANATVNDWASADGREEDGAALDRGNTEVLQISVETAATEVQQWETGKTAANTHEEAPGTAPHKQQSATEISSGSSNEIAVKSGPLENEIALSGVESISGIECQRIKGDPVERQRARYMRHQRVADRAAKALEEKNQRDFQAQKEQEERHRMAEDLDATIKRWAAGKEGNLRALLSTLQYVLWQESGWQPVPLMDLVPDGSVRKAYRKATLCLHPDKVQQKGATIQQKYTAEKVFDVLKEAWNTFLSDEMV